MQTIYLDVLLIQSLYVNYFLLRATAKLTHSCLRLGRCLAAAGGSCLFSLLIFLPPLPFWVQIALKLAASAVTVSLAFGVRQRLWLWQWFCFFGCNFLLAGLLLAVCSRTEQGFAAWGNSYCYLDFSLLQLILFTALAYSLLQGYAFFRRRHQHTQEHYEVWIRLHDKTILLPGLPDTGNTLTDPFTAASVIVCSSESLKPLLSDTQPETLPGYRLIPCATVTSQGLIPLFRPDEVCIRSLTTGKSRPVCGRIGIGGTQNSAIFHPDLIW